VPVRAHQKATGVLDIADPPPVTADVVIKLAVTDRPGRQPNTELGGDLLGGPDPWLAIDSNDERQILVRTDVQR
jgi:hypothetical protein